MKRKPKRKAPKLTTLRDKLDSLVSRYVRLSAADANGYVRCVSCGKAERWQDVDAGHYISRKSAATRFDLRNINPECKACNRFSADHLVGYTIWMQEKHGDRVIAELWASKHTAMKRTRSDYEDMIDDMATRLARLVTDGPDEEYSSATQWALQNVS